MESTHVHYHTSYKYGPHLQVQNVAYMLNPYEIYALYMYITIVHNITINPLTDSFIIYFVDMDLFLMCKLKKS